jgi:hypothetical protein
LPAHDCKNKTARIRQPGWDRKERTARKGQQEKDSQRRGQPKQDSLNSLA